MFNKDSTDSAGYFATEKEKGYGNIGMTTRAVPKYRRLP